MPKKTKMIYKKKSKNKSVKKRGKRVWMYTVGKVSIVYLTPRLHIQPSPMNRMTGGAEPEMNKELALKIMNSIKDQAKNNVSDKELEIIEKTLNKQDVCEPDTISQATGSLTSMSSKAFDVMKNSSMSLGKFLSPIVSEDEMGRRRNDLNVQMLWYPRVTDHYKKGKSFAEPKDKIRYGDFMIYVEPEKYADVYSYLSNTTNSVEDLLANVLNGCTDALCLKGNVTPEPYKHTLYSIHNYQPDVDDKSLQKTAIEITPLHI